MLKGREKRRVLREREEEKKRKKKERKKERTDRLCSPADGLVPQPETLFEDSVAGICTSRMVSPRNLAGFALPAVAGPRDTLATRSLSIPLDRFSLRNSFPSYGKLSLSREIIGRSIFNLTPVLNAAERQWCIVRIAEEIAADQNDVVRIRVVPPLAQFSSSARSSSSHSRWY